MHPVDPTDCPLGLPPPTCCSDPDPMPAGFPMNTVAKQDNQTGNIQSSHSNFRGKEKPRNKHTHQAKKNPEVSARPVITVNPDCCIIFLDTA